MEREWTAGPWEWGSEDYSCAWLSGNGEHGLAGDPYGAHVLTVTLCGSCCEHANIRGQTHWEWGHCATIEAANAKLIAAAPELYEALEYARRFLKPQDVDTDFIDAALAKASK